MIVYKSSKLLHQIYLLIVDADRLLKVRLKPNFTQPAAIMKKFQTRELHLTGLELKYISGVKISFQR